MHEKTATFSQFYEFSRQHDNLFFTGFCGSAASRFEERKIEKGEGFEEGRVMKNDYSPGSGKQSFCS